MKILVALLAVWVLMQAEGRILRMQDYHSILDGMFTKSCAAEVPNPSGLKQLKKEIEDCYKEKKLPVPDQLELSGVPIGLENVFPGKYISASSSRDEKSRPQRGRLNSIKSDGLNGAWCSEINNDLQYFQVDLGAVHKLTGIIIQGDHNELDWVRSYTLEISNDGKHWGCVFGGDGRVKVFDGNVDSDTPVTRIMNPVIRTRYFRIVPKSWTTHICLRAEIYVEEILPREEEEPEPIKDFETEILDVNPKRPEALVVKSFHGNQVDTGMVPEEWTDQRQAPIKSISFEHNKDQPQLFQVKPAGVVGSPLNPIDVKSLVISGGPVDDHSATCIPSPKSSDLPKEVATYEGVQPVYTLEYKWLPAKFYPDMYIEFAFGFPVHIRGISTRGVTGLDWVTAYKIVYLNPHLNPNQWVCLQDGNNAESVRIPANDDDTSPRDHIYSPAILTSRLRLYILGSYEKPAMRIKLSLGDVPREEPQILTSPVYEGKSIGWTWEDRSPAKGVAQEVFFLDTLTLLSFTLESGSPPSPTTITTYRLQYLVAAGQWRDVQGETSLFSRGEKVSFNDVKARGLRIFVDSWEGADESKTFYGQFSLKIAEDTSGDGVIRDIIELSSHYLYFKWEDDSPVARSAVVFSLGEEQELTRIETKGLKGASVDQYQLECRIHYDQQGEIMVLPGNPNDKDIVEHELNKPCKYVFIRPINHEDGIGMAVYLYSRTKLTGTTADIFVPPSGDGSFEGKWNPSNNGGDPYLEFIFNHRIIPTKIILGALERSSVKTFHLQRSADGENFENVLGTDNLIRAFPVGSSEFEVPIELRALRILPIDNGEGDNGFEYAVKYKAEKEVKVSVKRFEGTPEEPARPKSLLSGNYNHDDSTARQCIWIIFNKPEMAHQFDMAKSVLGSNITKFNLLYKADSGDEKFTKVEVDGETDFPGNSGGMMSVDLGDLEVSEFKVLILASEGNGVKFEYGLQLSGNIGNYEVRKQCQDARTAN